MNMAALHKLVIAVAVKVSLAAGGQVQKRGEGGGEEFTPSNGGQSTSRSH